LCGSNSENKRSIVESIKIVFCHPETFDLEFVGTKTCLTQLICEQYALRLSISSCPPFFAALRGELKKGKFTHVRYRFSLVKVGRKLLPQASDRGLNDMRRFRGGITLGVHKISVS
jgi:hypothetical protein